MLCCSTHLVPLCSLDGSLTPEVADAGCQSLLHVRLQGFLVVGHDESKWRVLQCVCVCPYIPFNAM